jgi:hypothetical protein
MAPPARSPSLGRAVRGSPFTRPDSAGTPTLAGREEFPPIELSENVRKFLEPITPGGKLEGRLFRVKPWKDWPMAKRIAFIRAFVTDTSRDPAIVEKATRILKEAGVESKDHERAWAALLKWVQENIYYVNERDERLQSPQYTLTERHGDCLPATTPLLRDDFELVPIRAVEPGQRIWGLDRWSTVEAVVDKGELPVDEIKLNNGSSFRATPGHKLYVKSCEKHGVMCPDLLGRATNCKIAGRATSIVRITVEEAVEGMEVLTPARLPFGTEALDPDRAYVEGLYLSDGWAEELPVRKDGTRAARFFVSGKDGHPKEAQKHDVVAICTRLGVETRWHSRYVAVNDTDWAIRLKAMGSHAPEKRAASINLDEGAAASLLRGIMADSGKNTNGNGRTYSSTSPVLAAQTRLLLKMFGRTCGYRYLVDHGGLGTHPIVRLGVRDQDAQKAEKTLRIKRITRNVATVPCFDIQTDDHYVYLPEADVTVSNCDDMLIVFAALGDSLRLPWRAVISGRGPKGVVAWTEGCGPIPAGVSWTHIFGAVGWPPFRPTRWTYAEPTLKVPLGWSVMTRTGGGPARADLGAADAAATPSAPAPAPAPAPTPSSAAQAPGPWISWRQVASTVTASVLSFWVTRSLMTRSRR